jgi:hypothetical protein
MKGLVQGSGISGATSNVKGLLNQARQYAITKGQKVYVIFKKDKNSGKNWMVVCAKYGASDINSDVRDGGGYYLLTEDPLPWGTNTLNGGVVYNLDNDGKSATIRGGINNHPHPAVDKIYTGGTAMGWRRGDAVGFEIAAKKYLPSGIEFTDDTVDNESPVIFNPDGSAESNYKIKFQEMYVDKPVAVEMEIKELTGWVEVKNLKQP